MNPPVTEHAPDPVHASQREQFLAERLNFQLFTLGRATQVAAFAAAVLLWLVFLALTRAPLVLAWAGLVHAAQAARAWAFRRNARAYPAARYPDDQPDPAVAHVVPMLALASVAWGLSAWLLIPPSGRHDAQAPVLVVLLFGMMAASIPAIMPRRRAIVAWMAPITLLLATRFAWMGDAQGWVMAAATLLFGVTMARFAMTQHQLQVASLRSELEKEELATELMARSRELQRLNQERNRFFASASHDLRQPVHALALLSRALQRDLAEHPLQPVASRVVQATDATSDLLNAMLDISRIDAGTVRPSPRRVAVDQIFLALAQQFEPRAADAGLALHFHTGPLVIVTDPDLVLRVLSNFVDNAIKHSAAGRALLVSARLRGGWLRLAVWDQGRGIPAEHLDSIFDEFYQVGNPQRDVARGLGIGLAIVKRLGQLLGARIGVRSVPARGSVFWLDLPLDASLPATPEVALEPMAEARAAATPDGRALRVLLLDDEPAVGEAIRLWLAPHCAHIAITQSLEQARARVQERADGFDAFIVDFRLADAQDGIAATAELRDLAGRRVPTILVTGDTDPARVRAAFASGLAVMFKPVQPDALLQTLHTLIERDQATVGQT